MIFHRNSNKKWILLSLLLLVSFLSIFLYFKKSEKNISQSPYEPKISNEMIRGTVKEVKNMSIIVEGQITSMSTDSETPHTERKTVEFIVNSQTIIKHSIIVISAEQAKSGKQFHPETKFQTAVFSDLAPGLKLLKITSKENLFKTQKATAVEINYYTYDLPPLPLR